MNRKFEILLKNAGEGNYAIPSFNIYNLEGATAVIKAAEELKSPVILQILPTALETGGAPLVQMCLEIVKRSKVPATVHLDHCSDPDIIFTAMAWGINSIMVDGSGMSCEENLQFTREMTLKIKAAGGSVEAELGKMTGEEDGQTLSSQEELMTDPDKAADFVDQTGISALAVCIGNIHGKYKNPPVLDFKRLKEIRKRVSVPLVLHGTSGLPEEMIQMAMDAGISKFNVNTELRSIYLKTMASCFSSDPGVELVTIMKKSITAMKEAAKDKIRLFRSIDKA
ncbi:class II fructose-bisphosphate aldolase [Desulfamplus magnetovallimortis]|nr:class II fructose-bisphosphate aldolase [Desulfamplus magnetovallimortis]